MRPSAAGWWARGAEGNLVGSVWDRSRSLTIPPVLALSRHHFEPRACRLPMPEVLPAPDGASPEAPSPARCYHCQAELLPGSPHVCSICGRRQTRTCFCGAQISRGAKACPHCGADWTHVRRRPRQSRHERRRELLRYAAICGGLALVASGLLLVLWQSLGVLSVAGVGHNAAAAWQRVAGLLAQHGRTVLTTVAVFAVGALGGVGLYHARRVARRRSSHRRRMKRTEPDE